MVLEVAFISNAGLASSKGLLKCTKPDRPGYIKQSLVHNYSHSLESTFMKIGHATKPSKQITKDLQRSSFVLLDNMITSQHPKQHSDLARAVRCYHTGNNCFSATHLKFFKP